jgi:hypothetical protein
MRCASCTSTRWARRLCRFSCSASRQEAAQQHATAPHQQVVAREAGDAVHLVGQKALDTSGAGEKKLELVHRGHGAAGAFNALLLEHLGQLAVGQGLGGAFSSHELFDERAHGRAGGVAPGFGAQARAEEILELVRANRRGHVLGRGHAADGGFVQAQLVGNVAQHQRAHGQLAVGEEALLPLDDGARDAQDGVEPLLDVLDEPARFLQALLQSRVAFAALAPFAAAQGASVDVVHAQARHHIGVERDDEILLPAGAVAAPGFAHDHIGDDDVALHIHKAPPGAGFQPGNQGHGGAGALFARSTAFGTRLGEAAHVAAGQHFQRLPGRFAVRSAPRQVARCCLRRPPGR